jgi:hypothetical protein
MKNDEWTVEHGNMIYQGDTFVDIISDQESRARVVSMHNTALAAEREKVKVANTQCKTIAALMQDAEKQLAAAQRQIEMDTECIERIRNHGMNLEVQLAKIKPI